VALGIEISGIDEVAAALQKGAKLLRCKLRAVGAVLDDAV
jgi:hypothetical protein